MAAEVNISSYSGSVVAGDWGPAFVAAFAALTAGGTINVDADVTIKTQVDLIPANQINIKIKGNLGNYVKTDLSGVCFRPGNVNKAVFEDLVFIGKSNSAQVADSYRVIGGNGDRVIVNRCEFYGVYAADAIIYSSNNDLEVTDCKFGGCAGPSGHIFAEGASLTAYGCEMYDYANWNGTYWDRQGTRYQWIQAVMPSTYPVTATQIGASATFVDIQSMRLDEGASNGIVIQYYPQVNVARTRVNVNGAADAYALSLTGVGNATINQFWAGYNNNNQASVVAVNCGMIEIDGLRTHNGDHAVELTNSRTNLNSAIADSGTLSVTVADGTVQRLSVADAEDAVVSVSPGYGSLHTFQNTTEVVPTR